MSHSVGAIAWYASPRSRLRRNASWLVRIVSSEIVRYVWVQSTLSPSWRKSASKCFSSSTVSVSHSSMKLRRLIGIWSAALLDLLSPPSYGGVKSASYGRDGSHRTP